MSVIFFLAVLLGLCVWALRYRRFQLRDRKGRWTRQEAKIIYYGDLIKEMNG